MVTVRIGHVVERLAQLDETIHQPFRDLEMGVGLTRSVNDQEAHVTQLECEVELLTANFKTYAASVEQSRIGQALRAEGITNVSEVQPASYEPRPVSPKKGSTLVAACFVGLLGGLCLALLSEQFDQSLRVGEHVEHYLRLPLLASIPRMESMADLPG